MSDLVKRLESVYPPRPRDLRLEAAAEIERLLATVAALTEENARLKACAEHYADANENWGRIPTEDVMGGQIGSGGYVSIYQADADGWAVAREALAGGEK